MMVRAVCMWSVCIPFNCCGLWAKGFLGLSLGFYNGRQMLQFTCPHAELRHAAFQAVEIEGVGD